MRPMSDSSYGGVPNHALLSLFRPGRRVLDIGCGEGAWGPWLRGRGAAVLVGLDVSERSVDAARPRYDRAICGGVEAIGLDDLGGEPFDTIVAADVLEHLVDPWRELRRWRSWVKPSGQLVISVPNLRDGRLLLRLAVRGRFDYSDVGGMMDRTHLRWFTAASMADELGQAGWQIERRGGAFGPVRGRLNRVTRGYCQDLLAHQLHLVARPTASLAAPDA
jgi:2-polyprenyl-3-methyl-5-hydroxy-6-metoxy-1,4-benzoquinol methylase